MSDFLEILQQDPPQINRIERALGQLEPAELARLLRRNPLAAFLTDYYFRLLPVNLALKFVEAPDLGAEGRITLFSCQLVRHFRSNVERAAGSPPAPLIDSYWRNLTAPTFVELYSNLRKSGALEDREAREWLGVADFAHLNALLEAPDLDAGLTLALFRETSDRELAELSKNIDLFDFIYRLARRADDRRFIERLDVYADQIILMRTARAITEDVARRADAGGKLPLATLARLVENSADESFRMALSLLEERGLIDPGARETLERLQQD
jgi:hypothetical protein